MSFYEELNLSELFTANMRERGEVMGPCEGRLDEREEGLLKGLQVTAEFLTHLGGGMFFIIRRPKKTEDDGIAFLEHIIGVCHPLSAARMAAILHSVAETVEGSMNKEEDERT